MGVPLPAAATICSTTPARSLNLQGFGVISTGGVADLVVLDERPAGSSDLRGRPARVAGDALIHFVRNDGPSARVYCGMRFAILAATIASVPFATGCVVSVDSQGQIVREEKQFTVSGTPELQLTTFDGAIDIQSWDKPDVLVEIEKRGATKEAVDDLTINVTQDGNRIELEVKRPSQRASATSAFHRSASAKLIVSMPRHGDVRARAATARFASSASTGNLELRTGDGSIRATEIGGEIELEHRRRLGHGGWCEGRA